MWPQPEVVDPGQEQVGPAVRTPCLTMPKPWAPPAKTCSSNSRSAADQSACSALRRCAQARRPRDRREQRRRIRGHRRRSTVTRHHGVGRRPTRRPRHLPSRSARFDRRLSDCGHPAPRTRQRSPRRLAPAHPSLGTRAVPLLDRDDTDLHRRRCSRRDVGPSLPNTFHRHQASPRRRRHPRPVRDRPRSQTPHRSLPRPRPAHPRPRRTPPRSHRRPHPTTENDVLSCPGSAGGNPRQLVTGLLDGLPNTRSPTTPLTTAVPRSGRFWRALARRPLSV